MSDMKMGNKMLKALVALVMLAAGAASAWAGGARDRNVETVVAQYATQTYQDTNANSQKDRNEAIKDTVTIEIVFEGGNYYLKARQAQTNKTYKKYLIGCQDAKKKWYVWSNGSWISAGEGNATAAALQAILTAARTSGGEQTKNQNMTSDENVRTYAYEVYLKDVVLKTGIAARRDELMDLGESEKVNAYLPDGALMELDGDGLTGDIVVALYPETGSGDALVFKRRAGFFVGEAELFNRPAYKAVSYRAKALALMYAFFESKGVAAAFKGEITSRYGNAVTGINWTLFSGLAQAEKEDALRKLVTVIGKGVRETYRETVNGKSVFGSAKGTDIVRTLYGDCRNTYIDAYLAFAQSMNRPVFASYMRSENYETKYDPAKYTALAFDAAKGIDEGAELARAAMRYYTWGVEYTSQTTEAAEVALYKGMDAYKEVKTDWFLGNNVQRTANYWPGPVSALAELPKPEAGTGVVIDIGLTAMGGSGYTVPFSNGKAGYPLPFAEMGVDSPRTFAYKMGQQLSARLAEPEKGGIVVAPDSTAAKVLMRGKPSASYRNYKKSELAGYKPFLPGGRSGSLSEAGVDTMGLLTGSVAMTGFWNLLYDRDGKQPGVEIDAYNVMTSSGVGRGADGKPEYKHSDYPTGWENYRLEPEDLEKCSLVIPDLSQIRLGDLVVRFGDSASGRRTQIGIVVGIRGEKPSYGSDQRSFMENVLVVSVREGFRQVTLGTWGNAGGVFGGFTNVPEEFHVRRLIRRNSVGVDTQYTAVAWDVTEMAPAVFGLALKQMREQTRTGNADVKERWIPNTGEYLVFTDLRLSATNAAGAVLDLASIGKDELEVFVAGAEDRGFIQGNGQGNIFNNKAGSAFELALVDMDSGEAVKLGKLSKPNEAASSYTVQYDNSYLYGEDGLNKKSSDPEVFKKNRIWGDDKGKILGSVGGKSGYVLGIRPFTSSSAWPGDDLLLKIGVRERNTNEAIKIAITDTTGTESSIEASAILQESDYVAVYDKKLLWRSNLYIDEAGGEDWNDVHPWVGELNQDGTINITGPNFNEWNYGQGGNKEAKGGQVPLTPFSAVRSQPSDGDNVQGRVAYDYPQSKSNSDALRQSLDNPFDYNRKMNELKIALQVKFNSFGNETTLGPRWNSTTGPQMKWSPYLEVATDDNALPGVGLLYYDWQYNAGANLAADLKVVNGTVGEKFHNNISPYNVAPNHIGSDCIGLAKNSANYRTNTYLWAPTNTSDNFRFYPKTEDNYATEIWSYTLWDANDRSQNDKIVNTICPGDIVYYYEKRIVAGIEVTHAHIGVVRTILDSSLVGDTRQRVQVIESYFDGSICYADNSRSLLEWGTENTWRVVRLK